MLIHTNHQVWFVLTPCLADAYKLNIYYAKPPGAGFLYINSSDPTSAIWLLM